LLKKDWIPDEALLPKTKAFLGKANSGMTHFAVRAHCTKNLRNVCIKQL